MKVVIGMTFIPTEKSSANMGLLKRKPAGIDLFCVSTLLFLISFTVLFISFIIFINCLQRSQNIFTSPIEQSRICRRGELVLCHGKIAYEVKKITYEHVLDVCSAIAEIMHTLDALVIGLPVYESTAD